MSILIHSIKWFIRALLWLCDTIVAFGCLGLIGYGLYWLAIQPIEKPFGLVILYVTSQPLEQAKVSPKPPVQAPAPVQSGISENDVMVTERDSNPHHIKKLSRQEVNDILADEGDRVSDLFSVPTDLRKRVEFWFKIYSTYTISHAVIHDISHPWIIYDVVNLNSVYDTHRSKQKRELAKSDMIQTSKNEILTTLDRLSKRKHYGGLTKSEKEIYQLFKDIKGERQTVFAQASKSVRIQLGQRDSVLYGIKKSGRYLPSMEKIFTAHHLPVELTRIPFLESSFNMQAYSKDGASGIWQFMAKTGGAFMRVSHAEGIDERNHPLKATEAAARLMKQNFKILRSWPLAVTAYNHGPGGMLKGIKEVENRNLNDLIEKFRHPYFGFASKNFYSEFLAILHVEKYQDKIFGYVEKDKLLVHDDVEIRIPMRVKFIMDLCGITQTDIQFYNPDLRSKILDSHTYLPEGYYLKLPKGKKSGLVAFYTEVDETNRLLDKMLGEEKETAAKN